MLLYVYDVDQKSPTYTNARRISFFKKIYGYKYKWKGKYGNKVRLKEGLIHLSEDIERVADSVLMVPDHLKEVFDNVFLEYQDMIKFRVFRIIDERNY